MLNSTTQSKDGMRTACLRLKPNSNGSVTVLSLHIMDNMIISNKSGITNDAVIKRSVAVDFTGDLGTEVVQVLADQQAKHAIYSKEMSFTKAGNQKGKFPSC